VCSSDLGDNVLSRIHAPIGLNIGAVSPGEIAVAIIGEITQQLRGPKEAKTEVKTEAAERAS